MRLKNNGEIFNEVLQGLLYLMGRDAFLKKLHLNLRIILESKCGEQ